MLPVSWKAMQKAGLVNTHSSLGSKYLDIGDKCECRDILQDFCLYSQQPS